MLVAHRYDGEGGEHLSVTTSDGIQMALELFDLLKGLFADPVGTPAFTLWLMEMKTGDFEVLEEEYRNREVIEQATKLAVVGASILWRPRGDVPGQGPTKLEMN